MSCHFHPCPCVVTLSLCCSHLSFSSRRTLSLLALLHERLLPDLRQRDWFGHVSGPYYLTIHLFSPCPDLLCESFFSNVSSGVEKLPGATTELELNINDGDEQKPRTIYFQTMDSKNTEEVGSTYELDNKMTVSDSDITFRMGKQMNSMQTYAGASAATLPVIDSFYLHDETYANSNTEYTLLHRDSYENHENAGDASDPEILRENVFETIPWISQFSKFFPFQITGMMGWQKAQ